MNLNNYLSARSTANIIKNNVKNSIAIEKHFKANIGSETQKFKLNDVCFDINTYIVVDEVTIIDLYKTNGYCYYICKPTNKKEKYNRTLRTKDLILK